jgi:hypothetical protein
MVARDPPPMARTYPPGGATADGTATPLHRWVRRYRRPFDLTWPYGSAWERIRPFSTGGNYLTSSRQHLVPCLWQLLIGGDWYQLSAWNPTEDGCCRHCGTRCAGRFEGPPEG